MENIINKRSMKSHSVSHRASKFSMQKRESNVPERNLILSIGKQISIKKNQETQEQESIAANLIELQKAQLKKFVLQRLLEIKLLKDQNNKLRKQNLLNSQIQNLYCQQLKNSIKQYKKEINILTKRNQVLTSCLQSNIQ